jgi:hypothetical protein
VACRAPLSENVGDCKNREAQDTVVRSSVTVFYRVSGYVLRKRPVLFIFAPIHVRTAARSAEYVLACVFTAVKNVPFVQVSGQGKSQCAIGQLL